MGRLNYIAWIKIGMLLLPLFLFSTSTTKRSDLPPDNLEIWLGTVVWFLIGFFGIPAFYTPKEVYRPKWNDNPFLFKTDTDIMKAHTKRSFLIFFHFSGYLMLAVGLGMIVNSLIRFSTIYAIDFQKIIWGTGCLIGVHRATKKSDAQDITNQP